MCLQSLAKQMKMELMLLETQWDNMPEIFFFLQMARELYHHVGLFREDLF